MGIILALLGAMVILTDGGKITWLEPPPFEIVADASKISRTSKEVIQGSLNVELSCKFGLTTDLSITSVSVKFHGDPVVTFVPNEVLRVEPVFAKRFNAVWVPNKLTLILFSVTDAEEGEYSFEVMTTSLEGSARIWMRKIQLLVQDPSQATGSSKPPKRKSEIDLILTTESSFTAPEDLTPATVFDITASEDPILTKESSFTAPEVDGRRVIIGSVVAAVAVIAIAIVCYAKRGKVNRWISRNFKMVRG